MTRLILALAIAVLAAGCDNDPTSQKLEQAAKKNAVEVARRGAWQGTVTVKTTASGTVPDPGDDFAETTSSVGITQTTVLTVNDLALNGQATANVSYTEETGTQFRNDYDTHTVSGNQVVTISASGITRDARVNVEMFANGRYTIDFYSAPIDGEHRITGSTFSRCKPRLDPECRDSHSEINETSPMPALASASGGGEGRIDKNNPNRLTGGYTENYQVTEYVGGRTVVTWTLSR